MTRYLHIANALVHAPPVLFLDEPTAGVDVELRRDLWTYVKQLASAGTTVVLTTHYLEEAEELADRIGVIKNGKLLVVEDKLSLLARFSHRTVRLALEDELDAVPPRLVELGASLSDDRMSLVLHTRIGEPLAAPLREVVAAGLRVKDVQTREPKLENVILEVLNSKVPLEVVNGSDVVLQRPSLPLP